MADIPHFAFPFVFTSANRAGVVEQDTAPEIAACVAAVISYTVGSRADVPSFGIEDQSFRTNGPNLEEIRQGLAEWEPRASAVLDIDDDLLVAGLVDVRVFLGKGTS